MVSTQQLKTLSSILPGELFLMKYEDSQAYGGPEEGGWWYNMAIPQWKAGIPLPLPRELRYRVCRWLNQRMHDKHNSKQPYDYSSVLSYNSTFYSYGLEDGIKPINPTRPYYE